MFRSLATHRESCGSGSQRSSPSQIICIYHLVMLGEGLQPVSRDEDRPESMLNHIRRIQSDKHGLQCSKESKEQIVLER